MKRTSGQRLNTYPDGLGIDQRFFSFLSVCQNWRAVAWPLLYQEAFLQVSRDSDKLGSKMYIFGNTDEYNDFPSLETAVNSGAEQMVKTLHVTVPLAEIASGLLVPLLESGPLAGKVFPEVTRVIFTGCADKISVSEGLQAEVAQNISEFCGLFRTMLPAASDIVFRLDANSATISEPSIDRIFELITKSAKGVYYVNKNVYATSPYMPKAINSKGLTSLTFSDASAEGAHVQIARLCVSTLESLCVSILEREQCINLIQDDIKLPLKYPHLKRLVFKKVPWALVELPDDFSAPDVVLFPELAYLECDDKYPYKCDILLRGNSPKIQHLSAPLFSELRDDFVLRIAMNPRYFPNLYHINIGPVNSRHGKFEKESLQVLNLLSSLAPGFRSLQSPMHLPEGCDRILTLLDNSKVLDSVQSLDLPNMKFTQDGLISIIGSLPQLVKLRCGIEDSRRQPRRRVGKSGVRYLSRRHTILQRCRFQTLALAWFQLNDSLYVAERILVLAILLPMMKHVVTRDEGECYDIEKHMPGLLESPVFRNHAGRLECVKFSASSTCCSVVSQVRADGFAA
ncbi:hypothetical protein EC988_001129 [Linderina pennispora]|nr:hypothetical protein EC988_001129 [Linderina pennispora]